MELHGDGYKVKQALDLARSLKHGPLPKPDDPVPTLHEAIDIIGRERRTCGFNWLTGEVAEGVLRALAQGRESDPEETNPYADSSDEHRAWNEGHDT